jgi:hypothetical protein
MGFTLQTGRIEDLDTPEAHLKLIRAQWSDLAAFSYQNYLSAGRGAVVFDLRNPSRSEAGFDIRTRYIAERSAQLAKLGGWPSDEIENVIADYDPKQDVVFLFLRLNGDVFHYNVTDELTPMKAFHTRSSHAHK